MATQQGYDLTKMDANQVYSLQQMAVQQKNAMEQLSTQQTFQTRMAELEQSGLDFRQAREIASREMISQLELAGVNNRFDQELAMKQGMFNVEQFNLEQRMILDHKAQLERLGLQLNASRQDIPTSFAANLSNTTMNSVNAIMADGNLSGTHDGYIDSTGKFVSLAGATAANIPTGAKLSSPKTRTIDNVLAYANQQISWAAKFYGTTIPSLTAPA
jgi:hypothetical protein